MIKVYRARTGVLVRTLLGHDSGVWGVCLVSAGGAGRATQRRARARSRTGVGTDDVDGLATRLANVEFPRDGLHVLPGESLGHLVPPVMQQALGFDAALPEGEAAAEQTGHGPAMEAREGTSHKTSESASSPCFASLGWGQPNPIIVSGGCDKVVRVWDLKSGYAVLLTPIYSVLTTLCGQTGNVSTPSTDTYQRSARCACCIHGPSQ